MKTTRAFLLSFTAGLAVLFGGHATLSSVTAQAPEVQVGPLPTA
jgi:hypothetical protein